MYQLIHYSRKSIRLCLLSNWTCQKFTMQNVGMSQQALQQQQLGVLQQQQQGQSLQQQQQLQQQLMHRGQNIPPQQQQQQQPQQQGELFFFSIINPALSIKHSKERLILKCRKAKSSIISLNLIVSFVLQLHKKTGLSIVSVSWWVVLWNRSGPSVYVKPLFSYIKMELRIQSRTLPTVLRWNWKIFTQFVIRWLICTSQPIFKLLGNFETFEVIANGILTQICSCANCGFIQCWWKSGYSLCFCCMVKKASKLVGFQIFFFSLLHIPCTCNTSHFHAAKWTSRFCPKYAT